eukprot:5892008-Amphidinium_carterae.2
MKRKVKQEGKRIIGSVSAVSSENEQLADSGSVSSVRSDDHSGVIRLAIRMSCTQKLFFGLALIMGFIHSLECPVESRTRIKMTGVKNQRAL